MLELYNYYSVQIIGLIFGLFLVISMVVLVKRNRMQEKHSIIWLFVGVLITIFSIFRDLLEYCAALLGVSYAPSALFAILLVCAYILMLCMNVSISSLKRKNKALIQEMGLIKLRLEEVERKNKEDKKVDL